VITLAVDVEARGVADATWALIMDRLVRYVAAGTPRPFFPAAR
jgi:hypothetical protein